MKAAEWFTIQDMAVRAIADPALCKARNNKSQNLSKALTFLVLIGTKSSVATSVSQAVAYLFILSHVKGSRVWLNSAQLPAVTCL